MAFDNLALSAGYGGILQCPYEFDEEAEELSTFDDDATDNIHGGDSLPPDSISAVADDEPQELRLCMGEEHSFDRNSEDTPDVKR